MKYIYKDTGMPGRGDISGSVLLAWHGFVPFRTWSLELQCLSYGDSIQLTEMAGTDCIVRVMSVEKWCKHVASIQCRPGAGHGIGRFVVSTNQNPR
ncbi:hypothetical protein EDD15DRAFT_2208619 [Pisolithus albus]|nr:hypothetical protein EDD15DRAFT_2208619 [Pisolithus albus]